MGVRISLPVHLKFSEMKQYILDSFEELTQKVSWPSWSELQSSTIVVAIASVIIALFVYFMDKSFANLLDLFYNFVN